MPKYDATYLLFFIIPFWNWNFSCHNYHIYWVIFDKTPTRKVSIEEENWNLKIYNNFSILQLFNFTKNPTKYNNNKLNNKIQSILTNYGVNTGLTRCGNRSEHRNKQTFLVRFSRSRFQPVRSDFRKKRRVIGNGGDALIATGDWSRQRDATHFYIRTLRRRFPEKLFFNVNYSVCVVDFFIIICYQWCCWCIESSPLLVQPMSGIFAIYNAWWGWFYSKT